MTTIRLHDTMAREKRAFAPADPKRVTMYVCGPTVYNRAHIGNARPAVVFDVLVEKDENCLPMIPSGKPHNEMILPDFADDIGSVIDAKGRQLV